MGTRDKELANAHKEIVRIEEKLKAVRTAVGKLAGFIRPGVAVWYEASPGQKFAAVVDSEPFEAAEGTGNWLVRLRELGEDYQQYNGIKRTTVSAAATWCLEPRELPVSAMVDPALNPSWRREVTAEEFRAFADPLIEQEKRMLVRGIKRNVDDLDESEAVVDQLVETTLKSFGQLLLAAYDRARMTPASTSTRSHPGDCSTEIPYDHAPGTPGCAVAALDPAPFDIVEAAWGVIANAGGGDWGRESLEWQKAAASWRDRYNRLLKSEQQDRGPARGALARIVSAIPNCGPLPSVIDDKYVDDVIWQLGMAIHGDRSVKRKTGKPQPAKAASLHEVARAHAAPGQTVVSGRDGTVDKVEQIAESMDAVHEAHRVLIASRADTLLKAWQAAIRRDDLPRSDQAVLVVETRRLLEDLALPPATRDPRAITEADGIHKGWYTHRPANVAELAAFVHHLLTAYKHDYGTIVHACAAAALAAVRTVNADPMQGGVTGFQASFVGLQFVREWLQINGPFGFRRYENMLYPQYAADFRTISLDTFRWLQEQAKQCLESARSPEVDALNGPLDPEVVAHWQRIVDGEVPFGFQIKD